MMIHWEQFTPMSSLLGGIMIGIASALFILFNGRIAGISGIIGGLLRPAPGEIRWRIAFLLGMLLAPALYGMVATVPAPQIDADFPVLVVAGLLVGIGTRYSNGCTSGHGVCGLARLSPRSLVATLVFMAAGFGTVFAVRHVFA